MDPSSTSRLDDLGASMDDLGGPTRHVVLAVEKTADAAAACAFLRDNVLRGSVSCGVAVMYSSSGVGRAGCGSRRRCFFFLSAHPCKAGISVGRSANSPHAFPL